MNAGPAWLAGARRQLAGWRWPASARHAGIVQSLPLGPGSRLLVVEFGGRRLLIGQSRAGLVRLAAEDLR